MKARRQRDFREGDRTEYLAQFGLSRIAFASLVPRPEDFGIDFFCALARRHDEYAFAESPFFVQVKATSDDVTLEQSGVSWVFNHMAHPLLICVCNKKQQDLTFYSCLRIWCVLFARANVRKLTLKLSEGNEPFDPLQYSKLSPTDLLDVELYLGKPILHRTLDQLENDRDTIEVFDVLDTWIRTDTENMARKRLGGFLVELFTDWETGVKPRNTQKIYYPGGHIEKLDLIERELAGLLATVAHTATYGCQTQKVDAARAMLNQLERRNLGDFEQAVADGRLPPPILTRR